MQLSVLIATHRAGLLPCSRIAQACSWAGPNLEVIVRDNSGDAQKRALLPQFQRDNCNIIIAEPCDGLTNLWEILKLARGKFIFMVADDDFCFDHGVAALPEALKQIEDDPSVVGVTGDFVVEMAQKSAFASFQNLDVDDVVDRATNFLNYDGPSVLHYSPIRRDLMLRIFGLMNSLPCYCSFHDQITCFFFLLNGKFARLRRLLYLYELGAWEKAETGQQRDVDFYKNAGLDPAINKLQWLLCGFEGAALVMHSDQMPDHSKAQRQAIADRWFAVNFARFKNHERLTFGSPYTAEAEKLCAKYRAPAAQISFESMLVDISTFMARFSQARAQSYFDYWSALIGKKSSSRLADAVSA